MAATLMAFAALSACSTPPRPAAEPGGNWLSGRLAVNVEGSQQTPAQSMSAGFELSGSDQQGRLRLLSPLGTLVADARWSPAGVWLDTGQGPQRFESLEALSRETFGETLPLAALTAWLRGQPWAAAPSQPLAQAEGPGFEQLGWTVRLDGFDSDGRVQAQRAQAPVVRVRARLDR